MPDELWQYRDRIGLDDKFLVLGAVALSDEARVTPLVVILVGEADRKRLDPAGTGARHHRDDAARIDAARQKRAERHIGHEAQPHRLFQMRDKLGLQFRRAARQAARLRLRQLPVAHGLAHLPAARRIRLDGEVMRGGQFEDAAERGLGCRHILQAEIAVDRIEVRSTRHAGPGEHRLDLGAKQKRRPVRHGPARSVIKRLFAEPVARQDQPTRAAVPQCQREHAAQPGKQGRPPGMPAIGDDLAVGAAAEHVTERRELVADRGEIVDLAIIGQPHHAIGRGDRLMPGRRQIDDREPRVPEAAQPVRPDALIVRAAMPDRRDHAPQPRLDLGRGQCRVRQERTRDAAHRRQPVTGLADRSAIGFERTGSIK